jgi:hypothetical protein
MMSIIHELSAQGKHKAVGAPVGFKKAGVPQSAFFCPSAAERPSDHVIGKRLAERENM